MSSRAALRSLALLGLSLAPGCDGATTPLATARSGVVFTYPADGQLDVPVDARLVVTFSDPVEAGALGACSTGGGGFCLLGPDGAVAVEPEVTGDGRSVEVRAPHLAPGTTYELVVGAALAPSATNLPAGPLVRFTTRTTRPRAAAPTLVAVNGAAVGTPEAYRPLLERSTVRLVFSEPLDPRTVALGPGALELVDVASGQPVPATLVAQGIHASIDPVEDLVPDASYELRIGPALTDLGGTPVVAAVATLTPRSSGAARPVVQSLRTREPGDPGPTSSRSGAEVNVAVVSHPLIGAQRSEVLPATLQSELGDPAALPDLGYPIAFSIRRGQRLRLGALPLALGGVVPTGLATGDMIIEFLTDADGRLFRSPHQDPDQRPENLRAPLQVELTMDLAIFTDDAAGDAVISQTMLGVQATGTAIATDGVLALETVSAMEFGLLGVATAPTDLVLELISDDGGAAPVDDVAPRLVGTLPADGDELGPTDGIELRFSEPVELDRLRAGLTVETAAGAAIPVAVESHGATVVVRPRQRLADATTVRVTLADVADLAGNSLADGPTLAFATPTVAATGVPLTVLAISPGAPCALTAATATTPGRCAGGDGDDDRYQPFTLAADLPIEVVTSQPLDDASATLGASCGAGSVRVERVDDGGGCVEPVPGTLLVRERGLGFVPDQPWQVDGRYRLTLVSGGDEDCDAGELCGRVSDAAASFDPLRGASGGGDAGGPALVIDFTGTPATGEIRVTSLTRPATDTNGNGRVDGAELRTDANRAALRVLDSTGDVDDARFDMDDCVPQTPETDGCMYLLGAMPVRLGGATTACPLPDGTTAAACVPALLGPQTMLGTSMRLRASLGISVTTDTETLVMRVREPEAGPPTGYIVDDGGQPRMVVALDVYMDAPDMEVTLSDHDLYSKPMALLLSGPVRFLADGRFEIALTNLEAATLAVDIDAPLGFGGKIILELPAEQMHLTLRSAPLRGGER
ncbi:MAG: Ig-like domain-containing protein [Kofleriaceae bacterium]